MSNNTSETYCKRIKLCDGSIYIEGCNSSEEANLKATDLAKSLGYNPPPKWKFWDQETWVR